MKTSSAFASDPKSAMTATAASAMKNCRIDASSRDGTPCKGGPAEGGGGHPRGANARVYPSFRRKRPRPIPPHGRWRDCGTLVLWGENYVWRGLYSGCRHGTVLFSTTKCDVPPALPPRPAESLYS